MISPWITYISNRQSIYLGFHAGSAMITRSALVSVRPRPPTRDVNKNIGAAPA